MARRGHGEGTYIKRADGTWEGRLRYIDPITGASKRKSFYGKTRAIAKEKLEAFRDALATGVAPTSTSITLGQWCAKWVTDVLPASTRLEASTKRSYASTVKTRILAAPIADVRLASVRPSHIDGWITWMLSPDPVSGRKAVTRSTARRSLNVLSAILKSAVREGLIAQNFALSIERPVAEQSEAEHLEQAELQLLVTELRESRYAPALILAAYTGMRRGEVLGLQWGDVDFAAQRIHIRHALKFCETGAYLGEPKTKRSRRTLRMTPELMEMLRNWRIEQVQQKLKAKSWAQGYGDLVFTRDNGKYIAPDTLLRELRRAAARAKVSPTAGLHTLRHTAASTMFDAGVNVRAVAGWLGHSSIRTTGDIYGHMTDIGESAAMEALSAGVTVAMGTK